jgi:hypothetical protein
MNIPLRFMSRNLVLSTVAEESIRDKVRKLDQFCEQSAFGKRPEVFFATGPALSIYLHEDIVLGGGLESPTIGRRQRFAGKEEWRFQACIFKGCNGYN